MRGRRRVQGRTWFARWDKGEGTRARQTGRRSGPGGEGRGSVDVAMCFPFSFSGYPLHPAITPKTTPGRRDKYRNVDQARYQQCICITKKVRYRQRVWRTRRPAMTLDGEEVGRPTQIEIKPVGETNSTPTQAAHLSRRRLNRHFAKEDRPAYLADQDLWVASRHVSSSTREGRFPRWVGRGDAEMSGASNGQSTRQANANDFTARATRADFAFTARNCMHACTISHMFDMSSPIERAPESGLNLTGQQEGDEKEAGFFHRQACTRSRSNGGCPSQSPLLFARRP